MQVLRAVLAALVLSAYAPVAHAEEEWREYVRVTFYTIRGTMRWGKQTYKGAAACGSYFPAGTKLTFVDDEWTVICEDTGRLLRSQVDVWAPSYAWGVQNIARFYGDYAWVRVERWGWGGE